MFKSAEDLEASKWKISVLPVFSKVVEKADIEQLIVFLEVFSSLRGLCMVPGQIMWLKLQPYTWKSKLKKAPTPEDFEYF